MKVRHLSASDEGGGAARAAVRLHLALLASGTDSGMLVGTKTSELPSIVGPVGRIKKGLGLLRLTLAKSIVSKLGASSSAYRSIELFPSGVHRAVRALGVDVLNLHWVCDEFMSIGDIGRIDRPSVWTFHDMWPFCGAEHLSSEEPDARWRVGYCNRNASSGLLKVDVDRWTWNRKRRAWRNPVRVVTPSRWLAGCVSSSYLMHDWPVSVVPNVLDTDKFRCWPKGLAREILGLPPKDVPLILFGAMGGVQDKNKGWDLLQAALTLAGRLSPTMECAVFGQGRPESVSDFGLRVHWLGPLHDDATLSLAYSAADVMVVPSRQENLPQTGTEAQSCGCPVVAFDCTGLPDVVDHGTTGYLASAYDPADLAQGIRWVLEDPERHSALSAAARDRAVRLWDSSVVVPQYLDVYHRAIEDWARDRNEK